MSTPMTTAGATETGRGIASDLPPLALWHSAEILPKKSIARVRTMLNGIAIIGEPRWAHAVAGDVQAATGLALWTTRMTAPAPLQVDLAATTVFLCALEGSRAAASFLRLLRQRFAYAAAHDDASEA